MHGSTHRPHNSSGREPRGLGVRFTRRRDGGKTDQSRGGWKMFPREEAVNCRSGSSTMGATKSWSAGLPSCGATVTGVEQQGFGQWLQSLGQQGSLPSSGVSVLRAGAQHASAAARICAVGGQHASTGAADSASGQSAVVGVEQTRTPGADDASATERGRWARTRLIASRRIPPLR